MGTGLYAHAAASDDHILLADSYIYQRLRKKRKEEKLITSPAFIELAYR